MYRKPKLVEISTVMLLEEKKGPATRIAGPKSNFDELQSYSLNSAFVAARASSSATRTLSIVSLL